MVVQPAVLVEDRNAGVGRETDGQVLSKLLGIEGRDQETASHAIRTANDPAKSDRRLASLNPMIPPDQTVSAPA